MSRPGTRQKKNHKKELVVPNTSDTEDEYVTASAGSSQTTKMNPADFIQCFKIALGDPNIVKQLQSCLTPAIDDLKNQIESYRMEVEGLKETIHNKDTEICKLHHHIEDVKQDARSKTIQIDGLPEPDLPASSKNKENVAETVSRYVTDKLKIPMNVWDIDSCYRVPFGDRQKTKRILVNLLSQDKRNKILKAGKELRQNASNKIFINEDLIPSRAEIFKTARLAKKDGKINGAWVFAGNVYIKKTNNEEEKPILLKTLSALHQYISG